MIAWSERAEPRVTGALTGAIAGAIATEPPDTENRKAVFGVLTAIAQGAEQPDLAGADLVRRVVHEVGGTVVGIGGDLRTLDAVPRGHVTVRDDSRVGGFVPGHDIDDGIEGVDEQHIVVGVREVEVARRGPTPVLSHVWRPVAFADLEIWSGMALVSGDEGHGLVGDEGDVAHVDRCALGEGEGPLRSADGLLVAELVGPRRFARRRARKNEPVHTGPVVDFDPLATGLGYTGRGIVEHFVDHERRRWITVWIEVKPDREMIVHSTVFDLHPGIGGVARVGVVGDHVERVRPVTRSRPPGVIGCVRAKGDHRELERSSRLVSEEQVPREGDLDGVIPDGDRRDGPPRGEIDSG